MTVKVVTVVGARPQFIKAAVVSRAIRYLPGIEEVLVHTGQHYDENMSAVFFDELDMPHPAYHLQIGSGHHGAQTGRMLSELENVLLTERPDRVLVYGDTNSTLAGALAAAKLNIPVAHVEAGLRSYNRRMPEEINRVMTDHLADLLFAPTKDAVANLAKEGIGGEGVHLVGDVMYDAALYQGGKDQALSPLLTGLEVRPRGYVLATVHRAANTDDETRLRAIVSALIEISQVVPVVFPVHPRTRHALERLDLMQQLDLRVKTIAPVGYADMVLLEKNAKLIATDSGGVQKEAFFYRVPCVTLRDETEWVELVELGWNELVPPLSATTIVCGLRRGLNSLGGREAHPYGDGKAGIRIAAALLGLSEVDGCVS